MKETANWEVLEDTDHPQSDQYTDLDTGTPRTFWSKLPRWLCYGMIVTGVLVMVGGIGCLYVYSRYGSTGFELNTHSGALAVLLGPGLAVAGVTSLIVLCVIYEVKKKRSKMIDEQRRDFGDLHRTSYQGHDGGHI